MNRTTSQSRWHLSVAVLGCAIALLALGGCDSAAAPTGGGGAGADAAVAAQDTGADSATAPIDAAAAEVADAAAAPFVPGDPPAGMVALGYGQDGDLAVEAFAPVALLTGQNYLAYRVTVAGAAVTSAYIGQAPQMGMGGTPHGAPVIDAPDTADANGLFRAITVFQMPSKANDKWRLDLTVGAPLGANLRKVSIDGLAVAESGLVKTFGPASGPKYIVSLYFAKKPKVGLNPYVVTVHAAPTDSDTFPVITDATLKAKPLMISMGHGSSGNVAPVANGDGTYAGKVNYSMPGEWQLSFDVTVEGKAVGTAAFKITL